MLKDTRYLLLHSQMTLLKKSNSPSENALFFPANRIAPDSCNNYKNYRSGRLIWLMNRAGTCIV